MRRTVRLEAQQSCRTCLRPRGYAQDAEVNDLPAMALGAFTDA